MRLEGAAGRGQRRARQPFLSRVMEWRFILRQSVVDEKGLDRAMKPAEVLQTAGPFVKTPITADDIG